MLGVVALLFEVRSYLLHFPEGHIPYSLMTLSGGGWWFMSVFVAMHGVGASTRAGPGTPGGLLLGRAQSIALAVELDDFGAMDEAVDEGDDAGGGGEAAVAMAV